MTTIEASTKQALEAYADAKNRHDVGAIVAACAPESYYHSVGLGQPVVGLDALRGFYTALFESIPDYSGDFDGAAFEGETAVVWGRFGGTLAESFMGIEIEAGRRLDVPVSFVCSFRDGQLVSDLGYFDLATLCEQAGISISALRGEPSPDEQAAQFVERFARFWADPRDSDRALGLINEDAVLHWPGIAEPFRGRDAYVGQLAAAVQLIPDLRLRVLDHSGHADALTIAWEATGTLGGRAMKWPGVDRFRLRDGKTAETVVIFDTQPLVATLAEATVAA